MDHFIEHKCGCIDSPRVAVRYCESHKPAVAGGKPGGAPKNSGRPTAYPSFGYMPNGWSGK